MAFAFVCQHSTFIVFNTLQQPTLENWVTVSRISLVTSGIVSLVTALVGYLSFFDSTEANILNSFEQVDNSISFL